MWKILALVVMPFSLFSNMGPQGFHGHLNPYFVETGTFGGDGIQKALNAGFKNIYSMDIDPIFVREAKKRFRNASAKVHVFQKDSGRELFEIIASINEPITFWLDAHNGFPDPNSSEKNTPLLEELDQIKKHHIKTHTILIDDLHCCNTLLFDFLSVDDIVEKVLEINPDYDISFEPGGDAGEYPYNVLVAKPKNI